MTIPAVLRQNAAPALNGLSTCLANRRCGFELMNVAHDRLSSKNPFSNLKFAAAWAARRRKRAPLRSRFAAATRHFERASKRGDGVCEEFSRKTYQIA
jgi:hypothetical protein